MQSLKPLNFEPHTGWVFFVFLQLEFAKLQMTINTKVITSCLKMNEADDRTDPSGRLRNQLKQ